MALHRSMGWASGATPAKCAAASQVAQMPDPRTDVRGKLRYGLKKLDRASVVAMRYRPRKAIAHSHVEVSNRSDVAGADFAGFFGFNFLGAARPRISPMLPALAFTDFCRAS